MRAKRIILAAVLTVLIALLTPAIWFVWVVHYYDHVPHNTLYDALHGGAWQRLESITLDCNDTKIIVSDDASMEYLQRRMKVSISGFKMSGPGMPAMWAECELEVNFAGTAPTITSIWIPKGLEFCDILANHERAGFTNPSPMWDQRESRRIELNRPIPEPLKEAFAEALEISGRELPPPPSDH